jgi:hypothetical protein
VDRRFEVEVERLRMRKDMVVAMYHVRTLRWNALQAGSLAAGGLAVVAGAGGTIDLAMTVALVTVAAFYLGIAGRSLRALDGEFSTSLEELEEDLGRLKAPGDAR